MMPGSRYSRRHLRREGCSVFHLVVVSIAAVVAPFMILAVSSSAQKKDQKVCPEKKARNRIGLIKSTWIWIDLKQNIILGRLIWAC